MPWVDERIGADRRKKFRAAWRDSAGRKHYGEWRPGPRSDVLLEAITEEERARAGHVAADRGLTWGQWRTEWEPGRDIEASTRSSTTTVINKWLAPKWDTVRLVEITAPMIRAWIKDMLNRGASEHTVIKAYHQLSTSLNAALEADKLRDTPCRGIRLPKPTAHVGTAFTDEEVAAIITAIVAPYSDAVTLLAYLGLRFGEMAGMHWADVHPDSIYVSHVFDRNNQLIKPYPKDDDCRWVPIPRIAAAVLNRRRQALVDRGVNPSTPCGTRHVKGECPGQLVIPGPHSKPLDSNNMMRRHFRPGMVKAGLDPRRLSARQHDLRHTFITWLIEDGLSAEEVAPIVGHSSTYITAKYTHLLTGHHDRARAALDARSGEQPGGKSDDSASKSAPKRHLASVQK